MSLTTNMGSSVEQARNKSTSSIDSTISPMKGCPNSWIHRQWANISFYRCLVLTSGSSFWLFSCLWSYSLSQWQNFSAASKSFMKCLLLMSGNSFYTTLLRNSSHRSQLLSSSTQVVSKLVTHSMRSKGSTRVSRREEQILRKRITCEVEGSKAEDIEQTLVKVTQIITI